MNIYNYTETQMTDVEFSRWLRRHGWKGEYHHIGKFCDFHISGKSLAVVKYKNDQPINRWIYLRKGI